MATVVESKSKLEGERRFVIPLVDWDGYEFFLRVCDRKGIRVTYDRGRLELMSPEQFHEQYSKCLAFLIEALCEEFLVPFGCGDSTTFRSKAEGRGIEPDDCYFFEGLRQLKQPTPGAWDPDIDAPPDLAVEIDITSSSLDRLAIYASIGVDEVWRFNGETLSVHSRGADRSWTIVPTSRFFPWLPLSEVVDRIHEHRAFDDLAWRRSVRTWIRVVFAPRYEAYHIENDSL